MISAALLSAIVLLGSPAGIPAGEPHWFGQLGLSQAWPVSRGEGIRIGLVDTGVNDSEPGLAGHVLAGASFPDLGVGTADGEGHGTAMASLIAAVAPEAKILPARLSGGAEDANNAIRWAVDKGAKVVNVSLGGVPDSTSFDAGLQYARAHDVVVVAAAGNAALDNEVTSPADRPGVVAVSAVDKTGRFAPAVSVSGHEISFAAPGVDVVPPISGNPVPASGTSHAAALVSGVFALVRARFPELTADQVTEHLARTANDLGAPGQDPEYGYGLVNPVTALTVSPPATGVEDWTGWWVGASAAGLCVIGWLLVRGRRQILSGTR